MSDTAPVLAGDLGGTRARLALFAPELVAGCPPREIARRDSSSREVAGIEAVVRGFLLEQGVERVAAATFGVAGAVARGVAELTNLGWRVERAALAAALDIPRLALVNDLVATAFGLSCLDPAHSAPLHDVPADPRAPSIVLGVGTGLGIALRVPAGGRIEIVPSEGGHMELAPRTLEEWELKRWLGERVGGRVSVERAVSGMGLRAIYDFLLARGEPRDAAVASAMALGDPSGAVAEAALAGTCPACVRALDLFVSMLGAVAGDLALLASARGGVDLAGGVPPKLLPKLLDGRFLAAFLDKGRLRHLVEEVPVRVVLAPDTALVGAALHAIEAATGAGE